METKAPVMVGVYVRFPEPIDKQLTVIAMETGEPKAAVIRQAVREWLDARRENGLSARG